MTDNTYEYNKYVCTVNNLRKTIEKYGVAILPRVLTEDECQSMVKGMWDYLEPLTANMTVPIKRTDPSTWRTFKELYPKHSMLLQHWSIGHAQFIWDLRTNPNVIKPFSKIWKTPDEDLLVSFDGASFHFPPEKIGSGWKNEKKSWLHTDQSYLRNDFECIQSWITANDVEEGDATLTVLEGSNNYHEECAKRFDKPESDDWYILSPNDLDWYINTKKCKKVNIKCPAGSMVFWDSRTIHCGSEPLKTRKNEKIRCVAYLCYTPRNKATPSYIHKRINAFETLRTTSHWPHKPKMFPKTPRTYGAALPNIVQISKPKISDIGYRLIGYDNNPNQIKKESSIELNEKIETDTDNKKPDKVKKKTKSKKDLEV